MITPRTGLMVVLAMDVGRYRAADGHHAGPGGHRHEQPERHESLHQFVEARSRSSGDGRSTQVDIGDSGVGGTIEDEATGVLRAVAVGPTQTPGNHASRTGRLESVQGLGVVVGLHNDGRARTRASPAAQDLACRLHA